MSKNLDTFQDNLDTLYELLSNSSNNNNNLYNIENPILEVNLYITIVSFHFNSSSIEMAICVATLSLLP